MHRPSRERERASYKWLRRILNAGLTKKLVYNKHTPLAYAQNKIGKISEIEKKQQQKQEKREKRNVSISTF